MDHRQILNETSAWIEAVVIGLNLCPFAQTVFESGLIRYVISEVRTTTELKEVLDKQLHTLNQAISSEFDNILLIHPQVLTDFYAYNDFLDTADQVIKESALDGVIQIASFHPDYRFADTPADDAANYTNRSPYPMLHLLREASVSKAVDSFPEVDEIPDQNINTMRSLGIDHIKDLYRSFTSRNI
ncbi:MAG TPA: DUF1415 domain-containing protein [candidate division Zixibacteria bacterium]|nr:DUF1415 domain-containing protein [candidate division Zixibacteria bacterium]